MQVIDKLPLTLHERLEMDEEIRIPATFDEFCEWATDLPYRVHYHAGEIISLDMGIATKFHELLVANLIGIFYSFFKNTDYFVYGSNRLVYIPELGDGFQPDVMIVKGEDELMTYKKGKKTMEGVLNPFMVVEVLSKGTRDFDLAVKLHAYKKIGSLQHILLLEQDTMFISTYRRSTKPNEWINTDYELPIQTISIEDKEISLSEIYAKLDLKK